MTLPQREPACCMQDSMPVNWSAQAVCRLDAALLYAFVSQPQTTPWLAARPAACTSHAVVPTPLAPRCLCRCSWRQGRAAALGPSANATAMVTVACCVTSGRSTGAASVGAPSSSACWQHGSVNATCSSTRPAVAPYSWAFLNKGPLATGVLHAGLQRLCGGRQRGRGRHDHNLQHHQDDGVFCHDQCCHQ